MNYLFCIKLIKEFGTQCLPHDCMFNKATEDDLRPQIIDEIIFLQELSLNLKNKHPSGEK